MNNESSFIKINILQFISQQEKSFLAYAALSCAGRSLPHVQDGLKPVHRRILYAMSQLHMTNKDGYKKSARIVGDVIGKYHPHGDKAVYDTMTNMAQPWSYRYQLVDGQGNWGSRCGDSSAAMRYTEARPSLFSDYMQQEIVKSAARYKGNFDNTTIEPEYLPVSFPNILCNGSEGIGVGMVCYIPPHNITEVCDAAAYLIDNPDCSTADLMQFIKAPDYATGSILTSSYKDLHTLYDTGKATIRLRARWESEKRARGQYTILITELPNKMSTNTVLAVVDGLLSYEPTKDEKPNQGKLDKKALIRSMVESITDVSDTTEDASQSRLVIVPKVCSKTPEEFMEALIPVLELEIKQPCDFTAMSIDYRPRRRTLKGILEDWVVFRRETMSRRCRSRIDKIERRLEILTGRLIVMSCIDDVIEIVRQSDTPKEDLIERFNLTERQALDVLDIKLRELQKLEEKKLLDERDKAEKELKHLSGLLNSKSRMGKLLIKEMDDAAKALGDERRTLISPLNELKFDNKFKMTSNEPVMLYVTNHGWLMSRKGHDIEQPTKLLKPDDSFSHCINALLSDDIILISSTGRSYTVPAESFPSGATSSHINIMVNIGTDTIVAAFPYKKDDCYLLCQSYGLGFVVKGENLHSRQRNGKEIFKLGRFDNANILLIHNLEKSLDSETGYVGHLNIHTSTNRFMQFDLSLVDNLINDYPKSQGLQLCKLSKKDRELVVFFGISSGKTILADGERDLSHEIYVKKRAGTPVKLK